MSELKRTPVTEHTEALGFALGSEFCIFIYRSLKWGCSVAVEDRPTMAEDLGERQEEKEVREDKGSLKTQYGCTLAPTRTQSRPLNTAVTLEGQIPYPE